MCLYVKKGAALKTAERDIVVYKTTRDYCENDSFISNYQYFTYHKDKTEILNNSLRLDPYSPKHYEINIGFHTFVSLLYTCFIAFGQAGIFIIPKGSQYYEGLNNGNSKGITSNQIVYKGKLTIKNLYKIWVNTKK